MQPLHFFSFCAWRPQTAQYRCFEDVGVAYDKGDDDEDIIGVIGAVEMGIKFESVGEKAGIVINGFVVVVGAEAKEGVGSVKEGGIVKVGRGAGGVDVAGS